MNDLRRKNHAPSTIQGRRRSRCLESLEARHLLVADVFVTHTIATTEAPRAMAVHLADLDGDADLDAISGAAGNGELAWFENRNDSDAFGAKQSIARFKPLGDGLAPTMSIASADLDRDGDLDLMGSAHDDELGTFWLENLDGRGTFGAAQMISNTFTQSIVAADLDRDQDLDLFTSRGWHENLDGSGDFSAIHIYSTDGDGLSVGVADFDADGDLDVAIGETGALVWYRNLDGNGTWSERQVLTGGLGVFNSIVADFDGDGDQDLLSANVFHSQAWFENTDGQGTFTVRHIAERGATRLAAVDIDVDGDLDVVSDTAWHENVDGKGNFATRQFVETSFGFDIALGDIDGDGDPDLLGAKPGANRVQWFRNMEASKQFVADQILTNNAITSPVDVQTADFDGDGDQDVVGISRTSGDANQVAWYENLDGQGTFRVRQSRSLNGPSKQLYAEDLDGDGDHDLALLEAYGSLKWFENVDGRGSFTSPPRTIIEIAWTSWFTDVDGDGDLDLLTTTGRESSIRLYENDSRGGFTFRREAPRPDVLESDYLLSSADFDGDGDQDLVVAARSQTRSITWQQNVDGRGSFGATIPIPTNGMSANQLVATDLDGDGDQDLIFSDTATRQVFWSQNTDGRGTFGAAIPISEAGRRATSILVADVDQDGDGDLVAGERYLNNVSWYEHLDGAGAFGPRQTVATDVQTVESIFAADLNGNGRTDLLSAAIGDSQVEWYERRIVGDANDDGLFNSSDLVAIFQAGEYEDAVSDNSTFDDGDWNGDGEFDSVDLVLAFQLGHYLAGDPPNRR